MCIAFGNFARRTPFCEFGVPLVTEGGLPYRKGKYIGSLRQFRDDILLGTDAPAHEQAVLQGAWDLNVVTTA